MLKRLIYVLVLGIAIPASASLKPRTTTSCFSDNFEGKGNAATAIGNPIGVVNSIRYVAYSGARQGITGSIGGVVPHSGTDAASAALVGDLANSPIGTVITNPFGTLVANGTANFDLIEFWFGCSVARGIPQGPGAQGCTVSVTGFDRFNRPVPSTTFAYSPANLITAPMTRAVLPATFRRMKNVTMSVALASISTIDAVLVIDDVVHCNYAS